MLFQEQDVHISQDPIFMYGFLFTQSTGDKRHILSCTPLTKLMHPKAGFAWSGTGGIAYINLIGGVQIWLIAELAGKITTRLLEPDTAD
jgi:hypothetical protein